MAKVQLFQPDRSRYKLPPVCARCGGEAAVYKRKEFKWFPPWVGITILAGLLPYVIIAAVLTKRMLVEVPLCDRHRYHLGGRTVFMLLSLVGLGVLGVAALVLVGSQGGQGRQNDNLMGMVCLGWAAMFLVWLVFVVVLQNTTIRPSEITEDTITLRGVAEEFARIAEDYEDSLPRRKSRNDRYDDRYDRDDRDEWDRPRGRVADDDRERYRGGGRARREEPPDERFE